jgi:serine protease Do
MGYLGTAAARAQEAQQPPMPLELPPVFDKVAPENLDDLREMEKHVQKVLAKVMPAVVGVQVGPGQGSGVIVNEDGTILTAGHVSGNPKQDALVILPGTKKHKGKTLGRNTGIDSGMLKIADNGKYPFVEMGKSADLKVGQWVIAIGHPGGFRENRTPVVRVGRILALHPIAIRTDCTLVGGDSGGPLFDMQGRLIGINSRIGSVITENVHVPIDTFQETWDRLALGESWGGQLGQVETVRSAGGKVVFEKKDALSSDDPKDTFKKESYCKVYTFNMKAGSTYTIDLISGDKSGKKLDTFMRLENADGKELAQDDDGGGFPHSRIVYKPAKDGDYRIIATSFEAKQVGGFTLKISEADFKDAVVAGKVEVMKAIALPSLALNRFLDRSVQAKVSLYCHAVVVDEHGDPMPNKEITFRWENGKETVRSNSEGVVRWAFAPAKLKDLSLEVPQNHRALVALTDRFGQSLALTFVERIKSAGGKVLKTIEETLNKEDALDQERKQCHRRSYEVTLVAGKTYTIDLVSEEFDAFLRLENKTKGKVAEDDNSAGNLNSRIVYTPTATSDFRIVVTTCDPGEVGRFRVTIHEAEAQK